MLFKSERITDIICTWNFLFQDIKCVETVRFFGVSKIIIIHKYLVIMYIAGETSLLYNYY